MASLFVLAVAPAALADEVVVAGTDNVRAPVTTQASGDEASTNSPESAEVQILELQEEIKNLRAEIADRDATGPRYLNQNLQPWR